MLINKSVKIFLSILLFLYFIQINILSYYSLDIFTIIFSIYGTFIFAFLAILSFKFTQLILLIDDKLNYFVLEIYNKYKNFAQKNEYLHAIIFSSVTIVLALVKLKFGQRPFFSFEAVLLIIGILI